MSNGNQKQRFPNQRQEQPGMEGKMAKAALSYLKEGGSHQYDFGHGLQGQSGPDRLLLYKRSDSFLHQIACPLCCTERDTGQRSRPRTELDAADTGHLSRREDRKFGENVPLNRAGQPSEIAHSYVFLAAEGGSYMTGQILHPTAALSWEGNHVPAPPVMT